MKSFSIQALADGTCPAGTYYTPCANNHYVCSSETGFETKELACAKENRYIGEAERCGVPNPMCCDDKCVDSHHLSPEETPGSGHFGLARSVEGFSFNQFKASGAPVNLFHMLFVAPFLLCLAKNLKQSSSYTILYRFTMALALGLFLYHSALFAKRIKKLM